MRRKNKQFGFSLIELLVAIAILGILAGMILSAFYSTRRQQSLLLAAQQVANDLNAQETKALNGVKYGGPDNCALHGISFRTDGTYTLCYYPESVNFPLCTGGGLGLPCADPQVSKRLPGGLIFRINWRLRSDPVLLRKPAITADLAGLINGEFLKEMPVWFLSLTLLFCEFTMMAVKAVFLLELIIQEGRQEIFL